MITITLEDHEVAAILAGLRLLQKELTAVNLNGPGEDDEAKVGWLTLTDVDEVLTASGYASPVGPDDIDALCERINSGE